MAEATLAELGNLIAGHGNEHVDAWRADGKPVVGYFCHYVPVEVVLAAGALPLRLRGVGSEDSSQGDALMSERICTYVRHVVSLALDDRYGFLDGVVCSNTCDHVRRAADVFRKKTGVEYHGFVSVPRSPRESLYGYYRDELRTLYDELAALAGGEASDQALRQAITTANEIRQRLRALVPWRLDEPARLTGAEALTVHIASQVLPPQVFLPLADQLLRELPEREPLPHPRARLLLIGAELDEPKYVEAIESQGAAVVADRLCFGERSVVDPIGTDADDPLDAIARAYFFRPSCARMMGDFDQRWAAILRHCEQARIDGLIFERLMFCDPWAADLHNMLMRSQHGQGPPLLSLTREYGIVPTGQVKTRVQAFVERLEIAAQRRATA